MPITKDQAMAELQSALQRARPGTYGLNEAGGIDFLTGEVIVTVPLPNNAFKIPETAQLIERILS